MTPPSSSHRGDEPKAAKSPSFYREWLDSFFARDYDGLEVRVCTPTELPN